MELHENFKLWEGFSTDKINALCPKIFNVLSRRIKKDIAFSSIPMDFSNSYGTWSGCFGIIGAGKKALRLNWSIGQTSSTIDSVDIWMQISDTPDIHIDTIGLNIVQIIDTIEDHLKGNAIVEAGRKSASDDIFYEWVDIERISDSYIEEMSASNLWKEFERWQYRQDQFNAISKSTFFKFLKSYMAQKGLEKRKGKATKGSTEKAVVKKQLKKEFMDAFDLPLEEKYEQIRTFIDMLENYVINCVIVSGKPGIGKSYICKEYLKSKNLEFTYRKGGVKSAKDLYIFLYENRDERIIVMDDFDVFKNARSINLIKAVTDTDPSMPNQVSYLDKDFIHPDKWKKLSPKKKLKSIPSTFEFTSGLIFLTNVPLNKINDAILSRAMYVDLELTNEDILNTVKENIDNFPPRGAEKEYKIKALEFLTKYIKHIKNMDFRDYIKCVATFSGNHSNAEGWCLHFLKSKIK